MKWIGYIFLTIGIALLLFVFYVYIQESTKQLSPVPDESTINIIIVTPKP